MHICPFSCVIGICKIIWNRTHSGLVTVDSVEIGYHFAFLRHGIKLAIFFKLIAYFTGNPIFNAHLLS